MGQFRHCMLLITWGYRSHPRVKVKITRKSVTNFMLGPQPCCTSCAEAGQILHNLHACITPVFSQTLVNFKQLLFRGCISSFVEHQAKRNNIQVSSKRKDYSHFCVSLSEIDDRICLSWASYSSLWAARVIKEVRKSIMSTCLERKWAIKFGSITYFVP